MEKFAIDLDKVLDEFEFNEDCAEQIATVNPVNRAAASASLCTPQYLGEKSYDSISNHDRTLKVVDKPVIEESEERLENNYYGYRQNDQAAIKKSQNSYDEKLNKPNIKPSVSNVFSSLNDYINAPSVSLHNTTTTREEIKDDSEDDYEEETTSNEEPKEETTTKDCTPKTVEEMNGSKGPKIQEEVPPKYENILLPLKKSLANVTTTTTTTHALPELPTSTPKPQQPLTTTTYNATTATNDSQRSILDEPERVYENVYIGTDIPKVPAPRKPYEDSKPPPPQQPNDSKEKNWYEPIYIAEQQQATTTTASASRPDEEKIAAEEVVEQMETPVIGFSKIDDMSEDELNKYLADLEAEERTAEERAMYVNAKMLEDNEDKNEAPIFERVTIGELPAIPRDQLKEKAKKFPIIDYNTESEDFLSQQPPKKQALPPAVKSGHAAVGKSKEESERVQQKDGDEETEASKASAKDYHRFSKDVDTASVDTIKSMSIDGSFHNYNAVGDHTEGSKSSEEEIIVTSTDSIANVNVQMESDELSRTESMEINNENESEGPHRPQTLNIVPQTNSADNSAAEAESDSMQSEVSNATLENAARPLAESSESSWVESNSLLGKQPPFWVPDAQAPNCMQCDVKFTLVKRRHHCRACGKVLCSKCCSLKYKLEYQGNADSRVCSPCYQVLSRAEGERSSNDWSENYSSNPAGDGINSPQGRQPNPNNPMEYCSTVPPLQQIAGGGVPAAPSVMVPVSVLKREGSSKQRSDVPKSVMFSDGIRPGCDLTDLDSSWSAKLLSLKKHILPPLNPATNSYLPQDPIGLPPTVTIHKGQISHHEPPDPAELYKTLSNDCEAPVMFAINRNLYALVKVIYLNCCVNRICWNVTSKGLACVGQDEVIFLIETLPDETQIPRDLFVHINQLYVEAIKGNTITDLGISMHQGGMLFGSREHAGFLFIRQTFQCLQKIILPAAPFLIALLVHRWETPWAKVFPLRLMLRLGAEYRYYPCPLVSVRFREALYFEVGHTIMKVLADFRNFAYTLPGVRGLTIHMENKVTDIMFPKNRYDQVIKGLNNSNDHVLAFASNFSIVADSHLVAIQQASTNAEESIYQTQAINIHNKPRKITGASFIVINGALKSSMGLSAKSSIVEDGLMVQIMPEKMEALKNALKNMQDFKIECGVHGAFEPNETVNIKWVENDVYFNVGVKSPIDNKPMDGIPSIRVHNGTDYKEKCRFIRWTEVFIIKTDEHPNGVHDPVDINKLSENIARATCIALVKLLDLLVTAGLTKLAVRATIHPENVEFEAGSEGTRLPPIYMNSLDNELIPVLHRAAQDNQDTHTVLELIFSILDM